MNALSAHPSREIRKLGKRDIPEITRHLLRLDRRSRRSRFGASVKDDFIRTYAGRIIGADALVFGAFHDGRLRAIGEVRGLSQASPHEAEIAVSVEPEWQGEGIGGALFSRLVTAAQNRGIKVLHVLFLDKNKRMRSIVAKHHPRMRFDSGQVVATFDPPWATPMSFAREIAQDAGACLRRVFQFAT
ncbi:GNAT family N-acetyltransferase [Pikeienuella sp. HZG-20]|uniref:GNAT family N-acetyltransferase n=1 Tax=Paludibacillus litoralis TaxID=3133267 RepID=UPI0030ED2494